MKFSVLMLALFFVSVNVLAEDLAEGSYAIKLTPSAENKAKGTDKAYSDVITIKERGFSTAISVKQGIKESTCQVTVEGEKIIIKTALTGRGTSRYQLELKDGVVTGKLIWDCDPGSTGEAKHAENVVEGKKN